MARYIKDYKIKGNADELVDALNKYILSERYQPTIYNNEQVYMKENDRLDIPSFLKITLINDTLRLEAWKPQVVYRGKISGETYFSGIAGLLVKEPIKKRVAVIEEMIKNFNNK